MEKLPAFQSIAREIEAGRIEFSTDTRLALRLRDALAAPDCHVDLAARLVAAEPLLAARVVALANSLAYNPYGREVSDLHTAISRIGFASLRSLSMALVARQLASGELAPALRPLVDQLWRHTAHVAALARVLARRVSTVDPEAALFAGLMHEVAGFFLIARSDRHPGLLEGDFDDWMISGEALIGRPLLLALGVPEGIRVAIEYQWEGYLGLPPVGLGDTLLLAEALSPVASPLRRSSLARPESARDGEIELLIGEALLSEILAESAGEVDSLCAALAF